MTIHEMKEKIAWLGHDGFRINASKTIYIDPYEIQGGVDADIILITHEHFDHCSPKDVAKIQKETTVIITEKGSAERLSGDVRIVSPGETISIGPVSIEAVPAYNINKNFHPRENGWLGFLIEIDGVRIYHAGDTDMIPEMKTLKADIALLPVSGTYVMTADEAIKAALAIQPAIAVPMHYGAIVGDAADAEKFKAGLQEKVEVAVLERSVKL